MRSNALRSGLLGLVGILGSTCLSCAEPQVLVPANVPQRDRAPQEDVVAGSRPTSVPSYCDAALLAYATQQNLDPDARYRPVHGNGPPRCQGSYGEKHALGDAVLVGLIMTCGLDPPPTGGAFGLVWQPVSPAERALRVHAQSLSSANHYSMDTVLEPGATSVSWVDPDLARLGITPANLGIQIWWTTPQQEAVYVPVSWVSARREACAAAYRFQFDFVRGSDSATIRIHPADRPDDGVSWLERGDYGGPTATVVIDAARFPKADIYRVDVAFAGAGRDQSFLFRATPSAGVESG